MSLVFMWLGSGFAFAVGGFMMASLRKRDSSAEAKANKLAEDSLAELKLRNNIGERMANQLERIADAAGRHGSR